MSVEKLLKRRYNVRVAGERASSKPTRAVCTVLAVSPHMRKHETVPVGFCVAGEQTWKTVYCGLELKPETDMAYGVSMGKCNTSIAWQ